MYIRRKVFSISTLQKQLEERNFSKGNKIRRDKRKAFELKKKFLEDNMKSAEEAIDSATSEGKGKFDKIKEVFKAGKEKAIESIKNNPKAYALGAAGVGALGLSALAAKKLKNKNKDKEEKELEKEFSEVLDLAFREGYEYAYKTRKYSDNSEKDERVTTDITKTKSYRGNGRAYLGDVPGLIGRAAGVKHATKLSKEGKVTDKEMVKKAGRRAALVGGALGSLAGAGIMYKKGDDLMDLSDRVTGILGGEHNFYGKSSSKARKAAKVAAVLGVGGVSALAARAGARKNVKERILKKHLEDNGIKADKKDKE